MFVTGMFMTDALIWAFGISAVLGIINAVFRSGQENTGAVLSAFVLSLVINFLVIWAILLYIMPAQTGTLAGYAWIAWPLLIAGIVYFGIDHLASGGGYGDTEIGFGGILGIMLFFLLGGYSFFQQWTIRSQGDANYLAGQMELVRQEIDDYPDTDPSHIVMVPQETAVFQASLIINEESNEKGRNLGTIYQPTNPHLQSINDHLYWIFDLDFASRKAWDAVDQISVGFIAVDAEDPNARPQIHLGHELRYTPHAYFGNKLERKLYDRFPGYVFDDLALEIDDEWDPYYTVTLNKKTLHDSGEIPMKVVIIDPSNSELKFTEYGFDEIPEWVDNVFSAGTVKRLVAWWGEYGAPEENPWKLIGTRGPTARYKIAGDLNQVYASSGHPSWQVLLSSVNKDNSTVGVLLFDGNVNRGRLFESLSGIAIESQVLQAFKEFDTNTRNWEPKHLSMYKIYGYPTWVTSYVSAPTDEFSGRAFMRIGFVSARDLQGSNVVYATNKEEALSAYRRALARQPSNDGPQGNLQTKSLQGTVLKIANPIEGGNTVYLIWLSELQERVFKAGREVSVELPFTGPGDTVVIEYLDVGGPREIPYDMRQFNNLSVPIIP